MSRPRSVHPAWVILLSVSCLLAGLVNQGSTYVTTGEVPRAIGNRHPAVAPYEMFAAADRPIVVAVGNDRTQCERQPGQFPPR